MYIYIYKYNCDKSSPGNTNEKIEKFCARTYKDTVICRYS